jgi:hypothetical protein
MKKTIFISLLIALSIHCGAQIKFESGYFITNDGKQTLCLIKNTDWKNNPKEFLYKVAEGYQPLTEKIGNVKEFCIFNSAKFRRFNVDIDRSSEEVGHLSETEAPEFKNEQLFLKVLIEGKATLYSYNASNLVRFFFSIDSMNLQQLIFKTYINSDKAVAENNTFKIQLWNSLQCSTMNNETIEKLPYAAYELTRIMATYNSCQKSPYTIFKKKKDFININIRPGVSAGSLHVDNSILYAANTEFGNKTSFRLGVEAEFILGFNKNKWAIAIEPVYQSYKSNVVTDARTNSIDYKSIESSWGVRHYFFLNASNKIFLGVHYIYDIPLSSTFNANGTTLIIKSSGNGAFAVGYKYKSKCSVEFKYGLSRNLLRNYTLWSADYKMSSVVFSYTVF